jgi:Kelch motif protein
MNDQELEARLRAMYRAEVSQTEAVPPTLQRDVAAISRTATAPRRLFGRDRGMTLLAAAATVALVGGALAVGSGVLRPQPVVVPPVIAPSTGPIAIASPDARTPSPSELSRPSASPVSVAGPGGTWIRTGSMINPGDGNLVRLLDGRVLAMGGDSSDGSGGQTAELYDPVTGTWSATGSPLRDDVGYAPATLLPDGRVLAGFPDRAELYDPATGTWAATGTAPNGGGYLASSALLRNGKVLVVFNGSTPDHQGVAALYDPASGTWTATSKWTATLYDSTAVTLPDGRVLVAGGSSACYRCSIKSAELYDPQTDSWVGTADMPWPGQHAYAGRLDATLLQDGTLLFDIHDAILGSERGGVATYDPSTGTWTAVEHPPKGAEFARLTRLLDGSVLMAGLDGGGAAEVYDPATRSWTKAASMLPSPDGGYPARQATLLLDGTVLGTGSSGAQLYIPAGVAPPTGLAPVPDPTPTPTPTPTPIPTPGPSPFPPAAGPLPQGARPWVVTVENRKSKPATLFLAMEPLNDMSQLCGSVTPNVVPAHTTEKVTFQMPPKGQTECWLMVHPVPGADGAFGPTDGWPIPGPRRLVIGAPGENGPDSASLWEGP